MFWLHRTRGDEELCNGLRRHSCMIYLESLVLTLSVGSWRWFFPAKSSFTSMDSHLTFNQLLSISYRKSRREPLTYSETFSADSTEKDQLCTKIQTPTKVWQVRKEVILVRSLRSSFYLPKQEGSQTLACLWTCHSNDISKIRSIQIKLTKIFRSTQL